MEQRSGGSPRVTRKAMNYSSTTVSPPEPIAQSTMIAPPIQRTTCPASRPRVRSYSAGSPEGYTPPPQRPPAGPAVIKSTLAEFADHVSDYYGHDVSVGHPIDPRQQKGPCPCPKDKDSPKKESLIEWFDRTVEAELEKRRDTSLSAAAKAMVDPGSFTSTKGGKSHMHPLIVESSVSGIDINAKLRSEQDTDLALAVDKLAKAEAMVAFEGAVRAAEEAAANAPPELAEEAAAAGVRQFNKEVTSVVQQTVPGIKPIEVVGYVGITRPKRVKKT